MVARIYKPAKTAMQSGTAKTHDWVLEHLPGSPRATDPLMGWTGSGDMDTQVKLRFATAEAAESYARKHGLAYRVERPQSRKPNIRPGGYGDNFAHSRRGAWTH